MSASTCSLQLDFLVLCALQDHTQLSWYLCALVFSLVKGLTCTVCLGSLALTLVCVPHTRGVQDWDPKMRCRIVLLFVLLVICCDLNFKKKKKREMGHFQRAM